MKLDCLHNDLYLDECVDLFDRIPNQESMDKLFLYHLLVQLFFNENYPDCCRDHIPSLEDSYPYFKVFLENRIQNILKNFSGNFTDKQLLFLTHLLKVNRNLLLEMFGYCYLHRLQNSMEL